MKTEWLCSFLFRRPGLKLRLDRIQAIFIEVFHGLHQYFQANVLKVPYVRSRPVRCTFIAIHYLLIILSFEFADPSSRAV